MIERRVRTSRQVYGRMQPMPRPGRGRGSRPGFSLNLVQRRLLILTALLGVVAYALWRLFAVTTVIVQSPGRGEEIKAETLKLIGESAWQANLLTLNDGALADQLKSTDPLLRSVEVRRKWLHAVRVTAVLKQPSMGWSSDDQQYLLDRDGTAIGPLPAGSTLPVVRDGSNLPVKVGDRVASSRFVDFITELAPALKKAGVNATLMQVRETTLDLDVSTDKGYRLVFDTSRTVEEEMADLKAVQALLASQKKTPTEYIDLRIAGKAYYK